MYIQCVNLTLIGDFTKTVTLRVITDRSSGIIMTGRRDKRLVPFLQRPLHGPDAQRSHVTKGTEVAISNNGLGSLETHPQTLKTSVVNTTGCSKALFNQTLEVKKAVNGIKASFL